MGLHCASVGLFAGHITSVWVDDDEVRKTELFREEKCFMVTQVQKAIKPLSTARIERMFNQLLSAFSVPDPNIKHTLTHIINSKSVVRCSRGSACIRSSTFCP